MVTDEDADQFAEKLMGATRRVAADYAKGDVGDEESFSGELCGRLKETLEGFKTENITWQADVALPGSGRARFSARPLTKHKEEPEFGADIIMVLDIETDDYAVRKGFLTQAKRLEPGKKLRTREHNRLLRQCREMLAWTPSSMVFLYHTDGLTAVPATAVISLKDRDLWKIPVYRADYVYRDFAICWFGDRRLQATDPASLQALRTLVDARAAIRIEGRGRDDGKPKHRPRRRRRSLHMG